MKTKNPTTTTFKTEALKARYSGSGKFWKLGGENLKVEVK